MLHGDIIIINTCLEKSKSPKYMQCMWHFWNTEIAPIYITIQFQAANKQVVNIFCNLKMKDSIDYFL